MRAVFQARRVLQGTGQPEGVFAVVIDETGRGWKTTIGFAALPAEMICRDNRAPRCDVIKWRSRAEVGAARLLARMVSAMASTE